MIENLLLRNYFGKTTQKTTWLVHTYISKSSTHLSSSSTAVHFTTTDICLENICSCAAFYFCDSRKVAISVIRETTNLNPRVVLQLITSTSEQHTNKLTLIETSVCFDWCTKDFNCVVGSACGCSYLFVSIVFAFNYYWQFNSFEVVDSSADDFITLLLSTKITKHFRNGFSRRPK